MEIMELIQYLASFIEPEYVILIPTLLAVGYVIKQTKRIENEFIPLILMAVGILLALGLGEIGVESAIQGMIASFASSWGYEAAKQIKHKVQDVQEDTEERVRNNEYKN